MNSLPSIDPVVLVIVSRWNLGGIKEGVQQSSVAWDEFCWGFVVEDLGQEEKMERSNC